VLENNNENSVPEAERPLILVVEDNSVNVRLIHEMLRSGGYRTCTATNGEAGVRGAQELQPALILTDLQMPILDGLAMTRQLKASAGTAGIPILALTAHAGDEHRAAAIEAGCAGFLTKPIRLVTLLQEVAHAIEHATVARA
jgi:CheY-like chemotaxis protein